MHSITCNQISKQYKTSKINFKAEKGRMTDQQKIDDLTRKNLALELENLALKQKLSMKESAIENSLNAIAFADLNSNLISVNKAFLAMWRYNHENEVLGKSVAEFWESPEQAIEVGFEIRTKNSWMGELTAKRSDGTLFNTQLTANLVNNENNEPIAMFASFIDITEKKKIEQALNDSKNQLSEIFDNSIDNIFVLEVEENNKFRIKFINNALAKVFNSNRATIEGKYIHELVIPDDLEATTMNYRRCINSREVIIYEEIANVLNKKLVYLTHLFPIFDQSGNAIRIIGISRNITERKQQEITIKLQNDDLIKLNADKDRFISILAHDLRSPSSAMLGLLDIIIKNIYKYNTQTIEEYLIMVQNSAQNTFNLLEDTLLWAKSQSGKLPFLPQKINLTDTCIPIKDSMQLIANNKNIRITLSATPDLFVIADPNMLKTILRNLISNAIKFTETTGTIEIILKKNHETALITVSDNGIGIAADVLEKLFTDTIIQTTQGTNGETGTGLGLLLCKEFIKKNNGEIWVNSEVGKGSIFKFSIPLFKI